MSEEKRKSVLTGRKKQIFYTGLVYLLVCFMTAGVTVFLTKEKKDEVKEVSAVVTEEPKVNTGYAAMETNPLLENRDEELEGAVEAYYQELSGEKSLCRSIRWDCDLHKRRQSKRQQDPVCTVQYEDPWNLHRSTGAWNLVCG